MPHESIAALAAQRSASRLELGYNRRIEVRPKIDLRSELIEQPDLMRLRLGLKNQVLGSDALN